MKKFESFLALGGLHEDKLCDILQVMALTNNVKRFIKQPYSISRVAPIDSDVVAYPRPAFSATKRTNDAPISFDQQAQVSQVKATYHTEIQVGKIEILILLVVS